MISFGPLCSLNACLCETS